MLRIRAWPAVEQDRHADASCALWPVPVGVLSCHRPMKTLCRALVLVIGFELACPGVSWCLNTRSPQTALTQDATARADGRLGQLEEWLTAVRRHKFGQADAEVATIGGWSFEELDDLLEELLAIRRTILAKIRRLDDDWPVRHQSKLFRGGISIFPDDLQRLGMTADEITAGDVGRLLKRVAVFHADVAMLAPQDIVAAGAAHSQGFSNNTVLNDGRVRGTIGNNVHWAFGRKVLDGLRAVSPSDDFVRAWYVTVSAHLERSLRLTEADRHLTRARDLFPRDAGILFAGGCVMEEQTAPLIQQGLRSVHAPPGTTFAVRSVGALLNDAEGLFRRAAELDPELAEARLRLARIVGSRGQHEAAIEHLRAVVASERRPDLLYLAHLFLGDEERALERWTAAQSSYERAATLYPLAQSPLLALSHLARARGDRAAAVRFVERLLRLPPAASITRYDPWWSYYQMRGEDADALFADLYRRVSEGGR